MGPVRGAPPRGRASPARRSGARADVSRPRRRPPAAYVLLLTVVAVLGVIGLVMVLSASSVQSLREYGSSWFVFKRQLLWLVLGVAVLAVTLRVDYRVWRRWAAPLLGVAGLLMVLVLVPGIGIRVGGSSRWLGMGSLRVQPSELLKLAILLFAADLLGRRTERGGEPDAGVRPLLVVFGLAAVLLLLQPDLGTTLIAGWIVLVVLFVAGVRLPTMAVLVSAAAACTLVLTKLEPYRWRRMTSFVDPWADATNTGYQAAQGLVALGSGRLTGVNLGASRAKWGFLPAAHTDFIFAIVGEELGLVGSLAVIALFAAFAVLGVRAALRAPDRFGTLVAAGATGWVVGQAVLNVGAVIGILPITGVPLPFVSAGGSALVVTMAAVGILLNVARQPRHAPARQRRV
jgi:cell division protein FtsW